MKKMKYCARCILPQTHESINFDDKGICNVCRLAEIKHEEIDWDQRGRILNEIIDRYRGKGQYDCIVPFSGGKDSAFQLWYVVKKLGLRPLAVRFNHWGYRPLVQENNVRTFKKLGVDVLEFTANWQVVKKLMLTSLKETGDFCWHCHTGVFAHTMQIAVKFNIPLVIWGEASSEYRAYHDPRELEELNEKKFDEMIDLGINADKMYELLNGEVDKRDLMPFVFPPKDEMERLGAKAIYLGNYIKWHTKRQVEIIKKELGCRTNHLACIDIRNGEIDRETGWELAREYDGKRPASLDQFLRIVGISEKEFEEILLSKEEFDWGFDHGKLEDGKPLPDMDKWDDVI